jgi:hypothetical protein
VNVLVRGGGKRREPAAGVQASGSREMLERCSLEAWGKLADAWRVVKQLLRHLQNFYYLLVFDDRKVFN